MSKTRHLALRWLLQLCFFAELLHLSHGDIGTASSYSPPYMPTACFGNDPTQFPTSNLFGAAGNGVWDNGASCGRVYRVRCLSAEVPVCIQGQTIEVKIVDWSNTLPSRPSKTGTTLILSSTAFGKISNSSSIPAINVEFQQV